MEYNLSKHLHVLFKKIPFQLFPTKSVSWWSEKKGENYLQPLT